MQDRKIAFIGAGNMAQAIIAGLVESGYPATLITASSPTSTNRNKLATRYGIQSRSDNLLAAKEADVIVLAVKPQMMKEVCLALKESINFSDKLVLTIAAGIPAQRYHEFLSPAIRLIRIMPNTPSLVGHGMSGLFAESSVSQQNRDFADQLMQSVGKTLWCDKEQEINHVIAVSGSSPAYFFLFMESMQQEAERLGFSAQQAKELVLQTAQGAVALATSQSETPFTTLREQVTSKGGTTAAALAQFYEGQLPELVAKAMQSAIKRAEEMENIFN